MTADRTRVREGLVRSSAGEAVGALEVRVGSPSSVPTGGVLRFRGEAPALRPLMTFTLSADDGEDVCGCVTRVFKGEAFVVLTSEAIG